jgi:hypothetical protein
MRLTMNYTYYREIQSSEHMLFAKEIAEVYGVTSQKVSSAIEQYAKHLGAVVPRLFYKTKYGLARVYSQSVWEPAMNHAGLVPHVGIKRVG